MGTVYMALRKAGEGKELFRPTGSGVGPGGAVRKLLTPEACQLFSGIYNNLLVSAGATRPGMVLICSTSEGERATTVAAGLAIAAAEKRAGQVLLIDGNCHLQDLRGLWRRKPGWPWRSLGRERGPQ